MNYEAFFEAVNTLGLIGKMSKEEIRQSYLALSKKYHPDGTEGDAQKFQAITEAYELLKQYTEGFRFMLDHDEFLVQFPLSGPKSNDWFYRT